MFSFIKIPDVRIYTFIPCWFQYKCTLYTLNLKKEELVNRICAGRVMNIFDIDECHLSSS